MGKLTLERKLRKVLLEKFKGATLELRRVGEERRVEGFLEWEGFVGQDQLERQDQLWDVLNESLSPEERKKLLIIYTMHPRSGARRPARTR